MTGSSPFYEKPEFPVRTPEDNQRLAETRERTAAIPVSELERWVSELELAENGGDVEDVVIQMRSFFPG